MTRERVEVLAGCRVLGRLCVKDCRCRWWAESGEGLRAAGCAWKWMADGGRRLDEKQGELQSCVDGR